MRSEALSYNRGTSEIGFGDSMIRGKGLRCNCYLEHRVGIRIPMFLLVRSTEGTAEEVKGWEWEHHIPRILCTERVL